MIKEKVQKKKHVTVWADLPTLLNTTLFLSFFWAIYQTLPMGSFFDEKVPFDLILI